MQAAGCMVKAPSWLVIAPLEPVVNMAPSTVKRSSASLPVDRFRVTSAASSVFPVRWMGM